MSKSKGVMPFGGVVPPHAEWRLLRALAEDLSEFIDINDKKLIMDIAEKRDLARYFELADYWGLRSIDPNYNSSTKTRDAALYLLCSFISKCRFDDKGLEEVTLGTFLEFERMCYAYNRSGYRTLSWSSDTAIQLYYGRMQQFIRDVIGETPDFRKCSVTARHGKGRTVNLNARYGNRFYKNKTLPYEVTANCLPHARRLIACDARWVRALEDHFSCDLSAITDDMLFRVVPGNLVLFVPKNAKTLRTIACEPTMNMPLQLGVDGFIRNRLKKFGIDIDDQTINQRLAREGSLTNMLSTFDLKGASDTITIAVIEKLLPRDWVVYLHDLRSETGTLPNGEVIRYSKLSSMGNGYTFAIETLIFAAAVFAVGGTLGVDSHVYGDDIILPSHLNDELTKLLNACGFIINTDKSFFEANGVRESCGTDYRLGINIRPVFLKTPLAHEDNSVFAVYTLHNKMLMWWDDHIGDERIPSVCCLLAKWLPSQFHCYGPPNREELSSYLVSRTPGRRTDFYGFIHDAVLAIPKTHHVGDDDWWWALLQVDIKQVLLKPNGSFLDNVNFDDSTGFSVTQRGTYHVKIKRNSRRSFAWPTTFPYP